MAAIVPGTLQLNNFSCNRRLARYVRAGQYEKTLELIQQMQQDCMIPGRFTFVRVLNACANLQLLEDGRHVHKQIIESGCESDIFVCNSLIDMYAKCGCMEKAWSVFVRMPIRTVGSWTAMILGNVKCGDGHKALELFQQMKLEAVEPNSVTFVGVLNARASIGALEEGRHVHQQILESNCESDVFVSNSLIDMYPKCGSLEDAWRVFIEMASTDVVSWNVMLGGFAMHGHGNEALAHFEWMCQEGMEIDSVAIICLLSACTHAGFVEEGIHYFDSMGSIFGIPATVEHYDCMVNLIGHADLRGDAEGLINTRYNQQGCTHLQ